MARAFITGFQPVAKGFLSVLGFVENTVTNGYVVFNADTVPYDVTSSVSVRQQIQENAPAHVNAKLTADGHADEATLNPSDFEFIS